MIDKLKEYKDIALAWAVVNKVWLMAMGGMFFLGFIWGAVVA